MIQCDTCEEWIAEGCRHLCRLLFHVFIKAEYEQSPDTAQRFHVYAVDHQDAGQLWATIHDRDHLYCDRSAYEDLVVISEADGSRHYVRIEGELMPIYRARLLGTNCGN